jgi:hypothetical protein
MNGQMERKAIRFGAAWTHRKNDDSLLTEADSPNYEMRLAWTRAALGESAFVADFR